MTKGRKTTFRIRDMDCSAEEQLVRMQLEPLSNILRLDFDLPGRKLEVFHQGDPRELREALDRLDLGVETLSTCDASVPDHSEPEVQRNVLWWVLGINFSFFLIEVIAGWVAHSIGLIADSLDMLADSLVYGLSLFAVGAVVATKKKIARLSGYIQMTLALLGFGEVLRRFLVESKTPLFEWMILIAALALVANVLCLRILTKAKSNEAHMQASAIFTSNDIIVNGGVIAAGILVYVLDSRWPDLLIGAIVFGFVMKGALKILKLSR